MIEEIRKRLDYSPITGKLFWRYRTDMGYSANRFNTMYAGQEAFCTPCNNGYLKGGMNGKTLLAHRLVWAWVHGEWPEVIDHINGDKTDNRITNLRSVPAKMNQRNMKKNERNTSGVNGVSWIASRQKWMATLGRKTLGRYNCKTAAMVARALAEQGKGYTERHGS